MKYNWEIQQGNYKNGLRYLLASFYWGASSTYVANSFYGNIGLHDAKTAKKWYDALKDAIAEKIVPSKIFIKNNIQWIMRNIYASKLSTFLNGTDETKTVKEIIGFDRTKSEASYTKQDWIDRFYDLYVDEYYKASEYGEGENIPELKVSKSKIDGLMKKNKLLKLETKKSMDLD